MIWRLRGRRRGSVTLVKSNAKALLTACGHQKMLFAVLRTQAPFVCFADISPAIGGISPRGLWGVAPAACGLLPSAQWSRLPARSVLLSLRSQVTTGHPHPLKRAAARLAETSKRDKP